MASKSDAQLRWSPDLRDALARLIDGQGTVDDVAAAYGRSPLPRIPEAHFKNNLKHLLDSKQRFVTQRVFARVAHALQTAPEELYVALGGDLAEFRPEGAAPPRLQGAGVTDPPAGDSMRSAVNATSSEIGSFRDSRLPAAGQLIGRVAEREAAAHELGQPAGDSVASPPVGESGPAADDAAECEPSDPSEPNTLPDSTLFDPSVSYPVASTSARRADAERKPKAGGVAHLMTLPCVEPSSTSGTNSGAGLERGMVLDLPAPRETGAQPDVQIAADLPERPVPGPTPHRSLGLGPRPDGGRRARASSRTRALALAALLFSILIGVVISVLVSARSARPSAQQDAGAEHEASRRAPVALGDDLTPSAPPYSPASTGVAATRSVMAPPEPLVVRFVAHLYEKVEEVAKLYIQKRVETPYGTFEVQVLVFSEIHPWVYKETEQYVANGKERPVSDFAEAPEFREWMRDKPYIIPVGSASCEEPGDETRAYYRSVELARHIKRQFKSTPSKEDERVWIGTLGQYEDAKCPDAAKQGESTGQQRQIVVAGLCLYSLESGGSRFQSFSPAKAWADIVQHLKATPSLDVRGYLPAAGGVQAPSIVPPVACGTYDQPIR